MSHLRTDFLVMPRRRVVINALSTLAVLPLASPLYLLGGCGGGALIVPFITFVFEGVVAGSGGTRFVAQLNLGDSNAVAGLSSGSYVGPSLNIRNPLGAGSSSFAGNGTFSGNSLTLNLPLATAPLDTTYSGEFVEPDTIVLTPANPARSTLTLLRADNSFRPRLDASRWTGSDTNGRAWKIAFRTDPLFDDGATELLTGTDTLAGQAAGTLIGYAAMRRLEITLTRGTSIARLSGRFGPAGTTPPPNTSDFTPAQTLVFSDGSMLTRDAGT